MRLVKLSFFDKRVAQPQKQWGLERMVAQENRIDKIALICSECPRALVEIGLRFSNLLRLGTRRAKAAPHAPLKFFSRSESLSSSGTLREFNLFG